MDGFYIAIIIILFIALVVTVGYLIRSHIHGGHSFLSKLGVSGGKDWDMMERDEKMLYSKSTEIYLVIMSFLMVSGAIISGLYAFNVINNIYTKLYTINDSTFERIVKNPSIRKSPCHKENVQ